MKHYNIRAIAVAREKIDKEVHQTAENPVEWAIDQPKASALRSGPKRLKKRVWQICIKLC